MIIALASQMCWIIRRDFFKSEMCLYSWPQMCMPGQYQFPFSFTLPVGLPGSFEYEEHGHVRHGVHEYTYIKAKIKYRIRAMCVVPGMFKANIRHKVSIGRVLSGQTSD